MSLERWQKYLKESPCPICGGTNSGKKDTRCSGYLHADGEHAFCQRKRSSESFNMHSLMLYKHPLTGKLSESKGKPLDPPLGEFIVEEKVTYHKMKFMHEKLEPFSKTFYVFYRDGEEIAKDVSLERIRLFSRDPHQRALSSEEYQSLHQARPD